MIRVHGDALGTLGCSGCAKMLGVCRDGQGTPGCLGCP